MEILTVVAVNNLIYLICKSWGKYSLTKWKKYKPLKSSLKSEILYNFLKSRVDFFEKLKNK